MELSAHQHSTIGNSGDVVEFIEGILLVYR